MGTQAFPHLRANHSATWLVLSWKCWAHWVRSCEDIKNAPSTSPGYSITTRQCSTAANCYCVSPRDILGSSQAGPSNAGIRAVLPKPELLDRWPQCPLYSLSVVCSPKQAVCLGASLPSLRLALRCHCWDSDPGGDNLPATTFAFAPASLLCSSPSSDVFPTSAYQGHSRRSSAVFVPCYL